MLFLGLDIGTQGARCAAVDQHGRTAAMASEAFSVLNTAREPGWREQPAESWLQAAESVLRQVCAKIDTGELRAMAIDGTSGTVLPLDRDDRPMGSAIMYDDARSGAQTERLCSLEGAEAHQRRHGYRFNSSYALPKIRWCIDNGVDARRYVNQTDYIVGSLTGEYGVTDYSNALKMGYDLIDLRWEDYIGQYGVDPASLPTVVACGETVGRVTAEAAARTGLPAGLPVCAGATDGYASSLAAGIAKPGDWASVVGTTLVLKGVTEKLIADGGSVYCHRHPDGWWMPGGASNAGGRYLNEVFGKEHFAQLSQGLLDILPSGGMCYPHRGRGERFPFAAPGFEPFCEVGGEQAHYAAAMEGVGYVERIAYETMQERGAPVGESIFTAGGGCKSREWLTIRASILKRELWVPENAEAAVGSAMLAASRTYFKSLGEAVPNMCVIARRVEPLDRLCARYDELYSQFRQRCLEQLKGGNG